MERFFEKQIVLFKLLSVWKPDSTITRTAFVVHQIYFWCVTIFMVMLFDISLLVQCVLNITSLNAIIKVFYMFATTIAVSAKYVSIATKQYDYLNLFDVMKNEEFRPVGEREEALFSGAVSLSQRIRNNYAYISIAALNVVLIAQYKESNKQLPISAYLPFALNTTTRYNFMYMYQWLAVSICCFMNIAFDSLSASIFIYICGQLDMLASRLEIIGHPKDDDAINKAAHVNCDAERVMGELHDSLRCHKRLIELAKFTEELVRLPMSIQIMSSILVLIANFYSISVIARPDDYADVTQLAIYSICMVAQIFILCYFSNEITLRSGKLSTVLFGSNWTHLNKTARRTILVMMLQFANPIRIHTINRCYSFNLTAFTSIVNSSYSYFALLKNINNGR